MRLMIECIFLNMNNIPIQYDANIEDLVLREKVDNHDYKILKLPKIQNTKPFDSKYTKDKIGNI